MAAILSRPECVNVCHNRPYIACPHLVLQMLRNSITKSFQFQTKINLNETFLKICINVTTSLLVFFDLFPSQI